MMCPNCQTNEATIDPDFGVTECNSCRTSIFVPHRGPEFTSEHIKESRREYRKDILQPFPDGTTLSREYLEEYGTVGLDVTEKDIKNAKYTYKDTPGYFNFDKSKGGRKEAWKEKNVKTEFRKK